MSRCLDRLLIFVMLTAAAFFAAPDYMDEGVRRLPQIILGGGALLAIMLADILEESGR